MKHDARQPGTVESPVIAPPHRTPRRRRNRLCKLRRRVECVRRHSATSTSSAEESDNLAAGAGLPALLHARHTVTAIWCRGSLRLPTRWRWFETRARTPAWLRRCRASRRARPPAAASPAAPAHRHPGADPQQNRRRRTCGFGLLSGESPGSRSAKSSSAERILPRHAFTHAPAVFGVAMRVSSRTAL